EKELKSLGHTIDSNGPLKLLIGELVVDQIGGQDIETTSNAIEELISQLISGRQTSEPSLLALSYSVEDDAYYIDYQWPEKLVGHLRLTTSLACQRGGQKDRRPPVWETIALSQRLKNRVWISPEFFNNSAAKLNSEGIKETSYGNPLLLEGQIRAQQLDIIIGFSTGFVSGFFTATLSLSSIESPANRNDGSSYRP
ncbi:MAG: hypothetical protein OEY09_13310, partial [Gammaproteobacteria bacterium]|nr:hypothetical protein [Gammaproteobacteria bacterium]